MFSNIKQQVKEKFESFKHSQLYTVEPDRDKIWELYLDGFSTEIRQEHNCNCCKSFLRQYGGIVSIVNNKLISMWDIEVEQEYQQSVKNIRDYIHSLPIKNVFLSTFAGLGTDKNIAQTEEGPVVWEHFHVTLPKEVVYKGASSVETIQGEKRDNKTVLKRSLDELTIDATETILELISQNSLYRGAEFKEMLESFLAIQKEYKNITTKEQDNYCWVRSITISPAISRIRNTSIGTLLIDLSNGRELDEAVNAFERVVAPTNYKRPNAIVTPRMVEEARKRLEELNLIDSLERRFANQGDVSIDNILFTDKVNPMSDVFADMSKDVVVNPKTLSKTEDISIKDFINNVLPTAKGLEILVENSHINNFVSLLTAVNKDSKTMFKWNNNFSWSYTGGITDSLKERVKAAGGNVDGVLRFSIQWNENGKDIVDLDAHAHEPNGEHIYYSSGYRKDRGNLFTPMSGQLDVDMINPVGIGVENIYWKDLSKMKEGVYQFKIHNYNGRRLTGFKAQIEFNGEVYDFSYDKHFDNYISVANVTYSKEKGFSIKSNLEGSSATISKEKWGIKTNQFVKVKTLMLSPNHWENQIGNKHFFFFLDNCVSDENPRPFFNEFLTEELLKEKRVFETMAGKLKVEHSLPQLSGIGFSETQTNHLYIKVEGNFKRILKINF